ncbi:exo-beta-N-acetylmuramidase NamZ domain-containing protein [Streptomyces cinerochromogenes]|uniref:Exo-beta-N-acetylmuramidase NamZ domain-containing protein n=1 Tax=Streptomyces cinerochromogenes TaxID=66422 RepID=A0ABW7B5F1_9ACTN
MGTDDRVRVTPGIARLHASPALAGPGRLGLVTNHTGVLPGLRPAAPALLDAGVRLVALFGPEHGLHGSGQAGESEAARTDPATGLPVHDTYRCDGERLDKLLIDSGVDALVYDLQDIGARFYTYVWTMFDLMVSAARTGVRFVVADRPNPLGGRVSEGPLLDPAWASFVGRAPLPVRHGLTCGELARQLNTSAVPEAAGRAAELTVIEMAGWQRAMDAEATGLPWIAPSPNIPTPATARVYPGTCLFEGTNLSEGRGTTRPFEIVGAPYLDDRFAPALAELALPGVHFRDLWYVPTFHKHAGRPLRGVQLHITDREAFAPVRTAALMLATVRRLYPDDFAWHTASGGVPGAGRRHFIDLLWGSDRLRHAVDAGEDPLPLCEPPAPPGRWAGADVLLYA